MESVASSDSSSLEDEDACSDVTSKTGNYFHSKCKCCCGCCYGSSSLLIGIASNKLHNNNINDELLPEHLLKFDLAAKWHSIWQCSGSIVGSHRVDSLSNNHSSADCLHRLCIDCSRTNLLFYIFTNFFTLPIFKISQNAQLKKLKLSNSNYYHQHRHHHYCQSNSNESEEIKNCNFIKSDMVVRLMAELDSESKALHNKVDCVVKPIVLYSSSSVESNSIVVPIDLQCCLLCSLGGHDGYALHSSPILFRLFQVLTCDSYHLNTSITAATATFNDFNCNINFYKNLHSVCQSLYRPTMNTGVGDMTTIQQLITDYFNSSGNDDQTGLNVTCPAAITTNLIRSYLQFCIIDYLLSLSSSSLSPLSSNIITMPCLLSIAESVNHPSPQSSPLSLIQSTSVFDTNSIATTTIYCQQQSKNNQSHQHYNLLPSHQHKQKDEEEEIQVAAIDNLDTAAKQYCPLLPNDNKSDSVLLYSDNEDDQNEISDGNDYNEKNPTWYQAIWSRNQGQPINKPMEKFGLQSCQFQEKTIVASKGNTIQLMFNRALSNYYVKFVFLLLLICHIQISFVNSSANIRATEKRILDSIIGDGRYDSRIRPQGNVSGGARGGDGPCLVHVNIFIRSISKISDLDMEYSVQVTFREQWVDSRLKFDNMSGQIRYLVLTDPNRVWRPDLFFKNEKEGHFHEIIMPNVLLRIYPEGDVLYSIRISLVLACPMNLKYYPLDKQICSIQMASYGYTTEDLMFVWKKTDPVQITTNLHLPRFTLEKYLTDYCTSKTNTGSYSCLKVDLLFKREFSYYLIQIYIPCCMLVIVSWVSFWLDPNAIPARVSLGVTTLLTMATSISGINSSLPPVSYTKAIDVWTGVCLTFVFGALLEFALVNYASRSDAHRAALKQQQAAFHAQRKWDLEHSSAIDGDQIDDRSASAFAMRPMVRQHGDFHGEKARACEVHVSLPKRNWCKRWLSKFPTRSKRIDVISRIFFPLMFAMFNLVYWTTYLFREDMQDL